MVISDLGDKFVTLANIWDKRKIHLPVQVLHLGFEEFNGDGLHFIWFFWFRCAELRLSLAGVGTLPAKWRDSRLVCGDGGGCFRLCAVGKESHDHGPLALAKRASGARSSGAGTLCRANDHFVPCGRGHREGRIHRKDDHDRPAIGCFQFVGFRQIVGGKIDRETALVCLAHRCTIARLEIPVADNGLVSVRPTALSLVCVHQLRERISVNLVVFAGQVARLVMSPKLTKWERADARHKRGPIIATPLFRYFAPVQRQRAARRSVAAF